MLVYSYNVNAGRMFCISVHDSVSIHFYGDMCKTICVTPMSRTRGPVRNANLRNKLLGVNQSAFLTLANKGEAVIQVCSNDLP